MTGVVRTGQFSAVRREADGSRTRAGSVPYEREVSAPAPTLTGMARGWWVDRPATTIQGDPRCFAPGGHKANDGRDNSKMIGRSEHAIQLSVEQAAVLQSFPPYLPLLPVVKVGGVMLDGCAGPGGWDLAGLRLGMGVVGVEWDDAAVATRRAAGLKTVQADVAELDVSGLRADGVAFSPPCPGFSNGGKGLGRLDLPVIVELVPHVMGGAVVPTDEWNDWRSPLTLQPARWIASMKPEWIVLEQVPAVLPVWEAYADALQERGYSVWTGIMSAEEYGVPQTRKRAVLIASRNKAVGRPDPTHERYQKGKPRGQSLTLLPWVSMAEALGWGMTERPANAVIGRSNGDGAPHALDGGSGARKQLAGAIVDGVWVDHPTNDRSSAWARSRVLEPDAAKLQTFPDGYPWQGTRTAVFQQIGNAVPPVMGEHALREATIG